MSKWNPWIVVVALGVLAAGAPVSAQNNATSSNVEQQIRQSLDARLQAFLQGNRDVYAAAVADGGLFLEPGHLGTKSQKLPDVHPAIGFKKSLDVSDFKVRDFGAFAIATYRTVEKQQYGDQQLNVYWHTMETYQKQGDRWILLAQAAVYDPAPRKMAKVDPALLDTYVGHYAWSPGYVEEITRKGNELMLSIPGETDAVELIPQDDTTFFIPNEAEDSLTTFVKDSSGKVTHYVVRQQGQEIVGKKIK